MGILPFAGYFAFIIVRSKTFQVKLVVFLNLWDLKYSPVSAENFLKCSSKLFTECITGPVQMCNGT